MTNLGEVKNGIVSFDDKESAVKSKSKLKTYHSSSEDEESRGSRDQAHQGDKKKQSVDRKSIEHKEKLRQRFLEKQKLSSTETTVKTVTAVKPTGKFYEGSSDEEEEEEDRPDPVQPSGSGDVFKNLKSFSNVWQDSGDEQDEDDSESESSLDSSDSEEEDEEDADVRRANLHKQLLEAAGDATSDPSSQLVMTRYQHKL